MASTYVPPRSAYAAGQRAFPNVHTGATNARADEGLGIEASLGADATWQLRFPIPPTLAATPAATLRLRMLANATSGNARIRPQWAVVAAGANPDTASLNDEGVQNVAWAAGDNDDYKEVDIALDAATIAQSDAGRELVLNLLCETASWTLAQVLTIIPYLMIDVE